MSELIWCKDLIKNYGSVPALNGINLTLESGKIVGLLGPNGSGKTTLIKLLNGLLTPSRGLITIDGKLVGPKTKAMVAYLPDNSYLNSWMTVKQIVEYFADFYEDFRPEVAYEMLNRLGIAPDKKLKTLSKGNKEKVCLILERPAVYSGRTHRRRGSRRPGLCDLHHSQQLQSRGNGADFHPSDL